MTRIDTKLQALLNECIQKGASDLHLSSNEKPYIRIHGTLTAIADSILSAEAVREILFPMMNEAQKDALEGDRAVDIGFSLEGGERFRGHIYQEKHGLAMAARRLDNQFQTLEQLGLPPVLARLVDLRDGLVLFTGPTGSGKTTTLATLIHEINRTRACHILTIEDPIEFIHESLKSLVHQRELHTDVGTFEEAVRSSLREDPDVLLVGEMRDLETMRAAIAVAETGHLVFATLHCGNAVGALDRLIGAFPAGQQESLCQQLSMVLRVVVAQRLLLRKDQKARVPAVEMLWVTKAVAHLVRKYKSEQIYTAMEGGGQHDMRTLEQSLAELVVSGTVDVEEARRMAENVRVFDRRIGMAKGDFGPVVSERSR